MNTQKQLPIPTTHGSIKPLIWGFLLSVLLTLVSFGIVEYQLVTSNLVLGVILTLAVVQLIVQLVFFLHLPQERAPRWQLIFFVSTVSIMLLVVVGSIWIMDHLNYNMMPQHMEDFILIDEGITPKGH